MDVNNLTSAAAAALKRRRLTLALFCLINFTTGALYVWSVFSSALAAHLTALTGTPVTHQSLGYIFGIASGVTPFMMIAGGWVNDRFGPKAVIGAGGALIGAGYLLAAGAKTPFELMLFYGFGVGIGTGLVNGCTINTAVKLFPDRRGFAGGLVTASLGIGAAVLPFAATGLIDLLGITETLRLFGLASGLLIVPAALMTVRCPAGFAQELCPSSETGRSVGPDMNWVQMIRTRTFWPLAMLFMTSALMGLMLLSSVSGIAQAQIGLSAGAAALAVSVISLANTAGRFLSGTISDRFGRVETLSIGLVSALLGLTLLALSGEGDLLAFFAGLAGVGLCFGGFIGIYPSLVADEYGPTHNSVNFSILMLGYSVGGLVGPALLKATAPYGFSFAYFVCMGIAVAGLGFAALFKWMKSERLCPSYFSR